MLHTARTSVSARSDVKNGGIGPPDGKMLLRRAECAKQYCSPRQGVGLAGSSPPGTLWVKGQPSTAAQGEMDVSGTAGRNAPPARPPHAVALTRFFISARNLSTERHATPQQHAAFWPLFDLELTAKLVGAIA